MKKGEVVDDGIKIEMVVLCKARDVEVSNPYGGVTTEHENRLSFVWMFREVIDNFTSGYGHLFDIFLTEVVSLTDV